MKTLAPGSTAAPALSPNAERLLQFFRTESMHWIVLNHACMIGAAGLCDDEFTRAVNELEAADLVERASYGPLLYIR